ncbi:MAG: M20/M25/M40 family metallo-hydrolase [Cyclobacteriaceae bacterium]
MELLKQLVEVHAPSGAEYPMKEFLLNYIHQEQKNWKTQPTIIHEDRLVHDNLILVFGNPRTGIFAHTDTIGFTSRYENQLVPIGSPVQQNGIELVGKDGLGYIECKLLADEEGHLSHDFARPIERGTTLTFKPNFRLDESYVQSPYMDNRLGVYNALKVAETLEDGVIVFSTCEEHGGGAIPYLLSHIQNSFPINQALVSDITWVTDGVQHGGGVVMSMRDRNIPRSSFIDRVLTLADQSGIDYQLEVEASGSSDGREIQLSPYPLDWMFIGAPEDFVHSPNERVSLKDIQSMIDMYRYLMKNL